MLSLTIDTCTLSGNLMHVVIVYFLLFCVCYYAVFGTCMSYSLSFVVATDACHQIRLIVMSFFDNYFLTVLSLFLLISIFHM